MTGTSLSGQPPTWTRHSLSSTSQRSTPTRDLVRRADGVSIRVASKSLHCRSLIERALARPGYRDVMSYSLAEALWLHAAGISDDLLVAYPAADRTSLRALAADDAARPRPRC